MTVAAGDPSISVVDSELSALVAADLSALIDGLPLCVMVACAAFTAASLHIPPAPRVVDNMVSFRTFPRHGTSDLYGLTKSIATPNFRIPISLPPVKHLLYVYSEHRGGEVSTPLGKKIRDLRQAKGYTLERLADLAESSKSYIWELENKEPPRPSAEKVAKIASVLGVTADYLMSTTKAAPGKDVLDQAFFREYQGLDESTKEKLRELVKIWGKPEQ